MHHLPLSIKFQLTKCSVWLLAHVIYKNQTDSPKSLLLILKILTFPFTVKSEEELADKSQYAKKTWLFTLCISLHFHVCTGVLKSCFINPIHI